MIEETAVVIDLQGDQVLLEAQRQSSCQSCSAKSGCGTGLLSETIGKKAARFSAYNNLSLKVGDTVKVGLHEDALIKGSFMVYILPLFTMVAFAFLGELFFQNVMSMPGELLVITMALAGLGLGFYILKQFNLAIKNSKRYQPVILHKLL